MVATPEMVAKDTAQRIMKDWNLNFEDIILLFQLPNNQTVQNLFTYSEELYERVFALKYIHEALEFNTQPEYLETPQPELDNLSIKETIFKDPKSFANIQRAKNFLKNQFPDFHTGRM